MKVFVLILALLLGCILPTPAPKNAQAEETPRYAVADSDNVWFYAEPNEQSGLFILPKTYYVLLLSEGEPFCAVRYLDDVSPYKSITGYCKTQSLTFVDFIPARPYLRLELTLTYALTPSAPSVMGNGSFDKIEKRVLYFGESYLGTSKFYYVYCDGIFDYIPATQEISYEENTDYLQTFAPSEPLPSEEEDSTWDGVQIFGICLCILTVAVVAVLLFKGKKIPHPQEEF